ncbi:MAG: hypothetical protein CMF62_02980 [Magnetococcales bacterium]|nr:hypothetical protein [Magnetococcales bacterium]
MKTTIKFDKPKFIPTIEDVNYVADLGFNKKTSSEWVKSVNPNYLYEIINPKDECVYYLKRNHLKRAQIIGRAICNNPYKPVILLDGHGRILYWILRYVNQYRPRIINKIRFFIPEIDIVAHEYHKLFFPSSCVCRFMDIKDMIEMLASQKPIIYANFCSIGGKEGIREMGKVIKECNIKNLLLSFSTRNIKNIGQMVSQNFRNYRCNKVLNINEKFCTYEIINKIS